jgi:hypothetical protein
MIVIVSCIGYVVIQVLCRVWDSFCPSRRFDDEESLMEGTRDSTAAVTAAMRLGKFV